MSTRATAGTTRTADRTTTRATTRATTRTDVRTTSRALRVHACVYFDDGGDEHLCSCGSRAAYLTEHDGVLDGTEPVLVVLEAGPAAHRARGRLAVSA